MENINFENKERDSTNADTMSSGDLIDLIYKGDSLPQNDKFLPYDEGGVFKYFDLNELTSPFCGEKFYPLIKTGNKIIGLAELEKNPYKKDIYWVKFVSIDPKYQGRGYSSDLVKEIFRFAKEKGISLEMSSYSDDGWNKLRDLFKSLSSEFSVSVIDEEKRLSN